MQRALRKLYAMLNKYGQGRSAEVLINSLGMPDAKKLQILANLERGLGVGNVKDRFSEQDRCLLMWDFLNKLDRKIVHRAESLRFGEGWISSITDPDLQLEVMGALIEGYELSGEALIATLPLKVKKTQENPANEGTAKPEPVEQVPIEVAARSAVPSTPLTYEELMERRPDLFKDFESEELVIPSSKKNTAA